MSLAAVVVDHVPPVSAPIPLSDTVPAVVFIGSLKVMTILPLRSTSAAPFAGRIFSTVGDVVSGSCMVVKEWLLSTVITFPAVS